MCMTVVTLLATGGGGGGDEGIAVSECIGVLDEVGTGLTQDVVLCAEGVGVGVEAGGTAAERGVT